MDQPAFGGDTMKRVYIMVAIVVALAVAEGVFYTLTRDAGFTPPDSGSHRNANVGYERIISLSPSVTETLFALGLGDRIVGVTRFCNYPPEAREKVRLGGYVDPNYEAVAMLEPDIVIVLEEHEEVQKFLAELDITCLVVANKNIDDILGTITVLGETFDVEKRSEALVSGIRGRIAEIQKKTDGLPRPSVLISVGRNVGTGSLEDVYVAGGNTYYDELIRYAGGRNAYTGANVPYPVISAEGLLHLDPDCIIDLVPALVGKGVDRAAILKDWETVPGLEARKNGKIFVLDGDYMVIPGPRFVMFLEDLVRILHPEISLK